MMKDYLASRFSLIDRGSRWLMVMGRLKPGVTLAQAQGNLTAISGQLQRTYPRTNDQLDVAVYSLMGSPFSLKGRLRSSLAILMAAVAVVLLIACANVANLLLARAASRRKEIAVRLALGGSRGRLVRQMLTESFVLASLGATMGLAIAFWTARSLAAFLPPYASRATFDTRPDTVVFAFTLGLTVITTLLFGLAPTLHASKQDLLTAMKANTATDGRGPRKEEGMRLNYETVGPEYFQAMGSALVDGRDFNERDEEGAPGVVVINETMARRYWAGGDALGRRIRLTKDWLLIVGIAKDVK